MFWEILIGGGGHVLEYRNIALRPILFFAAVLSTLCVLFVARYKIRRYTYLKLLLLLSFLILYTLIGMSNGNTIAGIVSDVKPFFFLLLLLVLFDFKKYHNHDHMIKMITFSSLVICIYILIVLLSLYFQIVTFSAVYQWGMSNGEFLFRGDQGLFFYKAVYVVCAGFLILITKAQRSKYEWMLIFIFATAILVTLTKGLILCVGFTAFLFLVFRRKYILSISVLLIAMVTFISFVLLRNQLDQSDISVSTRMLDFYYISDNTSFISFFVGNGFGSEIRGRLAIENSYLWIWWKMGVFPIIVYLILLVQSLIYFKRSREYSNRKSDSLLSIIVFVYSVSLINPLITNVIGFTLVFMCLIGLRHLPSRGGSKNA